MWETECRGAGPGRFEMESLEVLVLGEDCGKVGESLSRTSQIVESERGKISPASTRVEVVRGGASQPGATRDKVRYVEIL